MGSNSTLKLETEEEETAAAANHSPPPAAEDVSTVVVGKVVRAQEILARLGALLEARGEGGGGGDDQCSSLVEEAGRSLSEVIASLLLKQEGGGGDRGPAAAGNCGVIKKKCKAEDHGEKRAAKRSRSNQYLCDKIRSKTLDDGYTWRKYGQKEIHNAKYPRSYYRCTHKPDRGCQAQRQVQLCEIDPTTYIIAYFGQHTCKEPHHHPSAAAGSSSSRYIISFGPGEPPAPVLELKNESGLDADVSGVSVLDDGSQLTDHHQYHSSAAGDALYPPVDEGTSAATSLLPATVATQASEAMSSDHGDVTSELHPYSCASMDFDLDLEDSLFDYDVFDCLHGELGAPSWPCF